MFDYIINDNLSGGYNIFTLGILSLGSIVSSILVITAKNPIISVLFLISLFANISGYLILIGLNFIGISYLLVYIGAISILFIFILMLINIRISELHTNNNDNIPLGFLLSLLFFYPLISIIPFNILNIKNNLNLIFNWINYKLFNSSLLLDNMPNKFESYILNYNIKYSSSDNWENKLIENSQISSIGNIIYTNYSIWLIVASMILLLSMVGAIIITIKPYVNSSS